ncbi:MAG: hypothetical protein M3314_00185 [Actinomycetota bacterium]|nr:hypothetical protein [Actinomycetota bacterium]
MNWIWNRLRRRDERGAVLFLAVAGVILSTIAAALAVDLGRLAAEKRTDQKVADLAALDGVRGLPDDLAVAAAVDGSLSRNSFPFSDAGFDRVVEIGYIDGANGFVVSNTRKEAVRVTVVSPHKNTFLPGERTVSAAAVATADGRAQLWIGSNAANFDSSSIPVLNPVLTQFLGLNPATTLSLVGYQGLANGSVSLREIAAADASLGTPDQLLNSTVNVKKLALATVQALNNRPGSDTAAVAARTALGSFASNIDTAMTVRLLDLLAVQQPASDAVLDSQINVFDLIVGAGQASTAAKIASGQNFISVPGLTVGIPNLASSTLKLWVIEAPRISVLGPASCNPALTGPCVTNVQTAQVQVELNTRISVGAGCPGSLLCVADLQLPFVISAAKGTASLTAVRCGAAAGLSEADVRIDTAGADVRASGSARLGIAPAVPLALGPMPVVAGQEFKTFSGPPFPTAVQSASAQGLVLKNLISAVPVLGPVLGVVNPVLDDIDARILAPLFKGLGLSFAGADVKTLQILCGTPTLVG